MTGGTEFKPANQQLVYGGEGEILQFLTSKTNPTKQNLSELFYLDRSGNTIETGLVTLKSLQITELNYGTSLYSERFGGDLKTITTEKLLLKDLYHIRHSQFSNDHRSNQTDSRTGQVYGQDAVAPSTASLPYGYKDTFITIITFSFFHILYNPKKFMKILKL